MAASAVILGPAVGVAAMTEGDVLLAAAAAEPLF
jgi:hypothetical protein